MLKVLGAVLILTGTLYGGYSQVLRLKKREKLLRQLGDSLEEVQAELCFHGAPLGPILRKAGEGKLAEARGFLEDWADTLAQEPGAQRDAALNGLAGKWLALLTEEERQALELVLRTLGRYDIDQQRSALEESRERLGHMTSRAEEEKRRLGKVYMALSAALGATVVLLCI